MNTMVGFEDPVLSTGEDAIQTELFKRTAANDRQMLSEKSKTRLLSKEEQKQQWQDELLALSLVKAEKLAGLDKKERNRNSYREVIAIFDDLKKLVSKEEVKDEIEGMPKAWQTEQWKREFDLLVKRFMQAPLNHGANEAMVRQEFEIMLRRENIDQNKARYQEYLNDTEEEMADYAQALVNIESQQEKLEGALDGLESTGEPSQKGTRLAA